MTFDCPSNLIKNSTGLKGPLIPSPIGRKQLVYHAEARTSWTTRSGPSGSCKDRPASRSWGHRLSLEICVVNGYFLQSFWSNNWLVGWAILIYGVRCGHRGLLTRLVEAAQAGCSCATWKGLADHERSTGLTTAGAVAWTRHAALFAQPVIHTVRPHSYMQPQHSRPRRDTVPPGPVTPAHPPRILFLGPQVKTLSDINVVTRSATADHHPTSRAAKEKRWRGNDNKTSLAPLTVQRSPPFQFE